MYLIKCKCGCFFTVGDDKQPDSHNYECQNCGNEVKFAPKIRDYSITMKCFQEAEMTIQKIPDDADITITFKA